MVMKTTFKQRLRACISLALLFTLASGSLVQAATVRPNVVFFLVDDLGAHDLGFTGSEFYETPAIDQLAQEGVVFTQGYSAHPRCVPARYGFLTGKYPARAGIPGDSYNMEASEVTIGEAFQGAGYATFFAGKWHLAKTEDQMPQVQGFAINIGGGHAGAPGSYFFPYDDSKSKKKEGGMGPGLESGKPGEYLNDRLTDETVRFIHQHRQQHADQPFLVYLSHYAVHTPLQGPKEDVKHFKSKLEANGGEKADGYEDKDGQTKLYQDNAQYAAMVKSMDRSLGKIRDTLQEAGIADNTIIVFTSDHGGLSNRGAGKGRELATSNLPLRAGKGHLYEGGIRVPLIVLWPGVTEQGRKIDTVVTGTDHYPSLLEMAGIPALPEQHLDGVSYAPYLQGETAMQRPAAFWYSPRPRPHSTGDTAGATIRLGKWKYIMRFDPKESDELYDITSDAAESQNLIASEPQQAAELKQALKQWMASVNAITPSLDKKGQNLIEGDE